MNDAEKMGFIEQAKSELQQRIAQTDKMCNQFRKGFSGYSSNIAQISVLVVFGVIMALSIWAMFNADMFLRIISTQDYARNSLFAKMALAGVCLYMALHIYKKTICILRIAKIDGHILKVRNIEKYLQAKLNTINSIASDADKLIFGSANKKFDTEYDVDADIAKYSDLVRTYSDSDNSWVNIVLTIMHWLSGVLFAGIFLLISTPFVAGKIGEWTSIKEVDLIALVYIEFFLLLYIILQELLAKNNISNLHNRIKSIVGILSMVFIGGIILYFSIVSKNSVLFNSFKYGTLLNNILKIVIVYVPLVISVVFSSIMCFICKIKNRIINIFYMICIYGIALFCVSSLNSFPIYAYGNFWEAIFALCIPIAIATFSSSIISIISKIENKIFGFIVIGSGVIYTLSIIIMSIKNNIAQYVIFSEFMNIFGVASEIIRVVLIVAIVIIVIVTIFIDGVNIIGGIIAGIIGALIVAFLSYPLTGLIIFALVVIIPLFPGLIFLFVASRVNSRFSKQLYIASIMMLVAIGIAGFSITKNDWKFPSPSSASAQTGVAKKVTVTSDALNLRAEPSGDARIVKVLYKGDVLTVTGNASGGWTPIEHEGSRGWVSSEFIR
jgi:hypothetical protein